MVKVVSIRESGSNATLRWAISNNADIKDNLPLISIINDELFYLVTIEGINAYELFRLTQTYRNKIRVCAVNRVSLPSKATLDSILPSFGDRVTEALEKFTGIVTQMHTDDDIIQEGTAKLFLPMITTTCTVQLPLSFVDAVETMTEKECRETFSPDYPGTLESIPSKPVHSLNRYVLILIEKAIQNIRYDKQYEQLLRISRYQVIRNEPNRLYSSGIVSFSKYDPVTRGELRCPIFAADPNTVTETMRTMKRLTTPLDVQVAIRLPIYYMQLLEASFFPEDLQIAYRSSVGDILDTGIIGTDFYLDGNDEESVSRIEQYRLRIMETNLFLLKLIANISSSTEQVHSPSMAALLPPSYQCKAVIQVSSDSVSGFKTHTDPVIRDLFTSIETKITGLQSAISK